jgi:integrase/recombinase XerC
LESLSPGGNGRRLTGAGVYDLVRRLGGEVGLEVRPHGLRHAGITTALDRTGGDLRAVQRFSPNRDVPTVGLYDDAREDVGGRVARLVASAGGGGICGCGCAVLQ